MGRGLSPFFVMREVLLSQLAIYWKAIAVVVMIKLLAWWIPRVVDAWRRL